MVGEWELATAPMIRAMRSIVTVVGRTPWSAAGPLAGAGGTRASRADQGVRPTLLSHVDRGRHPGVNQATNREIAHLIELRSVGLSIAQNVGEQPKTGYLNLVLDVVAKGYKIGDSVIRPAQVVVSS